MLAVEADTDSHTSVVLYSAPSPAFIVTLLVFFISSRFHIALPLDDQASFTSRYKPLKDCSKLLANLLKRPLDRLILLIVKMIDELLDT